MFSSVLVFSSFECCRNTYFSILGGGFCKCLLSLVGSDGFSSLHFPVHPHLAVLSIIESGVMMSPTIVVELSVSFFSSFSFCFMYFGLLVKYIYL